MVTGGLEAAGDAITGAVLGRAVESDHGEATGKAHGACLNCGADLFGPYCGQCGQSAHVHRTLAAYGHDLLHSVFHFEGKVWRTLPLLALKPGELTRRYIHGERAKFVSPLALFLFSVFLMFAVVGGLAGEMKTGEAIDVSQSMKGKSLSELQASLDAEQSRRAAIETQIGKIRSAGGDAAPLQRRRDALDGKIEETKAAQSYLKGDRIVPFKITTSWHALDASIAKANDNPSLFFYKIQSSAYKYSWALIPLSVPFLWLLFFWHRQLKMYDHAVFVTYSLTFMLFLVVVLTVAGFIGLAEPLVPLAAIIVPPLHMYRQLRGAYRVSRLGGLVRTILLSAFAALVLIAFLALLLMLGALG